MVNKMGIKVKYPNNYGGAALEYVVTSVFALMFSIAVIAFVGKAIRSKLESMEKKLGIEFETDIFDNFGN